MEYKVFDHLERLLEISERKSRLLQSVMDQYEHIESNPIFKEEITDAFMELDSAESELIQGREITIDCPSCGYECSQIHNFCLACGAKLPENSSAHGSRHLA